MQKLAPIIKRIFKVEVSELSDKTELKSLAHWDSLNHMLLITELEKAFGCRLEAEEIVAMTDFASIRSIIENKVS